MWLKLLSRRQSISNVRQANSVVASVIPVPWYPWLCVTFSLWEWSGSMTSNRVWHRWQHMNGYVRVTTLHNIILPTLLECTNPCPSWFWRSKMPHCELPYEESQWEGESILQHTASKELRPWFWQHKDLSAADNHTSRSFPSRASDKTAALANTCSGALWDTEPEHPANLFLDSWPTQPVR